MIKKLFFISIFTFISPQLHAMKGIELYTKTFTACWLLTLPNDIKNYIASLVPFDDIETKKEFIERTKKLKTRSMPPAWLNRLPAEYSDPLKTIVAYCPNEKLCAFFYQSIMYFDPQGALIIVDTEKDLQLPTSRIFTIAPRYNKIAISRNGNMFAYLKNVFSNSYRSWKTKLIVKNFITKRTNKFTIPSNFIIRADRAHPTLAFRKEGTHIIVYGSKQGKGRYYIFPITINTPDTNTNKERTLERYLQQRNVFEKQEEHILQLLPNDVLEIIFKYACPTIDLKYDTYPNNKAEDEQNRVAATQNLQQLINIIMNIRSINKHYRDVINRTLFAWLHLNKNDANLLLIRSAQANIPYFTQCALKNGADINFIHKPDGNTPLLYMTNTGCYSACTFLLNNGADINQKRAGNQVWGYGYYNPGEYPIFKAVARNKLELVKLYIEHGAILDIKSCNLLSKAAKNSNPYILNALLEARPSTGTSPWPLEQINNAILETGAEKEEVSDQDKIERRLCLKMLREERVKIAFNEEELQKNFLKFAMTYFDI